MVTVSSTPEQLFFTLEYQPGSAATISRGPQGGTAAGAHALATAPTAAPNLPQTPILAALPEQVALLVRDPDGDIRLTIGREDSDFSVRVEAPRGLLPAIRQAESPIQLALEEDGLNLESFDARSDASSEEATQDPQQDGTRRSGRSRAAHPKPRASNAEPTSTLPSRLRILDVRA